MSGAVTVTLHLNAGDETRIMAYREGDVCLPLCDIKCGGMTGRTVAEGERIAAEIVDRYNAAPHLLAALQDIVTLFEMDDEASDPSTDVYAAIAVARALFGCLARAKATEQGEG